jgi:hypothetical protein
MSEINQPRAAAVHHVVDLDRLAIGLNDQALHRNTPGIGLLADHLELLSRIAVETVRINAEIFIRRRPQGPLAGRIVQGEGNMGDEAALRPECPLL